MTALMDMDDFIAMIVILIILLAGVTTLWVIINDKEK
tara:strand:- start:3279 stop:3389 length:111 start_codon:yes stop_codon:yes gene_type:complete